MKQYIYKMKQYICNMCDNDFFDDDLTDGQLICPDCGSRDVEEL